MDDTVAVETCSHRELQGREFMGERTYICTQCHKKLVIPAYTLVENVLMEDVQRRLADLVGEAFGELWKQDVLAYRI